MKDEIFHDLTGPTVKGKSLTTMMVCFYIFLVIERPWESIDFLREVPIERIYAIIMIVIAIISGEFKIVRSPLNKWVYGMLALHFILAPFAYSVDYALDQGVEYAKMIALYLLMLSVADDEESLKFLIKAFIYSMLFYMLHSLWEYYNGRHVYRMGISRMIGVDATHNDPNAFGASVVLSLPFVYALLKTEIVPYLRKVYLGYFGLSLLCIILTGSRSAFIALIFLLLLWGYTQSGGKKVLMLIVVLFSLGAMWTAMPEEKKERMRTLWDEDAGPSNAHSSARGRLAGLKVSWEMFKREPFTGVGAGGQNFIYYRVAHSIDGPGSESAHQAHILYGEVLAEFGIMGAAFFAGMVLSILKCAIKVRNLNPFQEGGSNFSYVFSGAVISCLLVLLLLGLGGHNFYRPMWLWLAAWIGALYSWNNKNLLVDNCGQ